MFSRGMVKGSMKGVLEEGQSGDGLGKVDGLHGLYRRDEYGLK